MINLGGVFLSLLVAILEFLWHARKNHENRQVSQYICSLRSTDWQKHTKQ